MRFKKILLNIITGVGGNVIIMAMSLIIPRLMLTTYGSEVNGLFTTVGNFYTYLSIVEAGIGVSALQLLYKPINENDRDSINSILYTTKKYYQRCGIIYLVGVAAMTILFPIILKSELRFWEIALVTLLQGMASILNYFVLAGVTTLLQAEGKNYVINNVTLLISFITNVVKIVLVNLAVNIVVLQFSYFCVTMLSILLYLIYFKVKYPWIDRRSGDDTQKLPQRTSFLIHNVSTVIFNNTDTILISLFCGLKEASVYGLYYLVFSSLLTLINSLFNGLTFTLGQTYNADKKRYVVLHDAYKSYYCAFVFAMVSVAYVLITPFLTLYTAGVEDISYVDKYLPILFCLTNLLSSCRKTEANLINLSFHAKQTLSRTILESVINLTVSIVLVNFIGIYGCLLGTIVALLYRTNDFVIYANKRILNRKPVQAYITLGTNFLLFGLVVLVERCVTIRIDNYAQFVLWGICLSVGSLVLFITANSLSNQTGFKAFVSLVKNRSHRRA